MLSGFNGASLWAADASESAGYLVGFVLGRYSSGLCTEWSPPDEFDAIGAASLCQITQMSGLVVALSWIGSLVSLLPALVFLLVSLSIAGGLVSGDMLILFGLMVVKFCLVGVLLRLWASSVGSES